MNLDRRARPVFRELCGSHRRDPGLSRHTPTSKPHVGNDAESHVENTSRIHTVIPASINGREQTPEYARRNIVYNIPEQT